MNTEELKNKILQLAMQGKLVEQDPNDEPASLLLKKIQKEKERLVKEKKIRKSKPLPPITEDEIPFEIPNEWEWVRLGEIIELKSGRDVAVSKCNTDGIGIPYIMGASNIVNEEIIIQRWIEKPIVSAYKGELLLTVKGSVGKIMILDLDEVNLSRQVVSLKQIGEQHIKYLRYFMKYYVDKLINKAKGVVPGISREDILSVVFPLPPLNEQKHIAEKVDELLAIIEQLDNNKYELLKTIDNIRNKILQSAVQGKLVPQDPTDEPASILLEKIKEEKERLIKEKKIRKSKPLPPITEDEIPFEIPEGWEWVRLGEIIELKSGRDVAVSKCNTDGIGIPYIMGASNIVNEEIIIQRWIEKPIVSAYKGELLLTVKGSVGKIMILDLDEVNLSRQVVSLKQIGEQHIKYLRYFMKYYVDKLINKAKGVVPGISREDILSVVFPLPPFTEQKRIVEKVDELMALCDELERQIIETEQHSDNLQKAVLQEVL